MAVAMNGAAAAPPLAILVAASALAPLAMNVFLPSLPGLELVFGTSRETVQLALSLFLASVAVGQLVYGPTSDRFGRRPMMLAGMGLFCVGTVIGAFAASVEALIVGRVIQALGGSCGLVLARAIVRDIHARDEAASRIAYLVMAMVVAPMVAPVVGGLLHDSFGWRAGFVVTLAFGLAVLALAAMTLVETNHERRPIPGVGGLVANHVGLLTNPGFRGYALHTGFASAGFFAFLGGGPTIMVDIFGRTPTEYGLYFMLGAAGYMVGNFVAGRLSGRFGVDRMMAMGGLISFAGAIAFLFCLGFGPAHPLMLFGPMTIAAFGNGVSMPNGMAGAVSIDPKRAGTASGMAGFLQMTIGAVASWLAGVVVVDWALPLAMMIGVTSTLALVYALMTWRAGRSQQIAMA